MAKKRTVKYWIGQVHLWLGLVSGVIVVIVSLTGCLFVFQKEISELIYNEIYFVNQRDQAVPTLPLTTLQATAQAVLGTARPINNITAYRQPGRAWEFMAYASNDSALTYVGSMDYYQSVFVDPYSGVVTGRRDYKYDFFSIVKAIHWSLLLRTDVGQPIVGWSTLIFALLLITGIVLWWPKKWTKAYKDRSFKIKWKATFKRVNYDLHNVPGFYTLFPALLIAMTGMVFSFRWFSAMVYTAAAGTTTPPRSTTIRSVKPALDSLRASASSDLLIPLQAPTLAPMDRAFVLAQTALPGAARLGISPATAKEGTIYVYGYRDGETYYGYDVLQFDQYTGQLLYRRNNSSKNRGERLLEMNYDIHVGAAAGLTGKIIAFIASLVCASLPITGFLIWWGKRRKKPRALG